MRRVFRLEPCVRYTVGMLPNDLNQMLRGYMESRAALTALELDVFNAIGLGSTAGALARKLSTDARATEMLLNALVAMGLLTKQREMFCNTPATVRYFMKGSEDDARPGLLHVANLWHRWSTLTECVRAGTSVGSPGSDQPSDEWTRNFIAAMHYNASERPWSPRPWARKESSGYWTSEVVLLLTR